MPSQTAAIGEAAAGSDGIARAHARLLADTSLQLEQTKYVPPKVPDWLKWLGDLLSAMQPGMKWVFWVGLALLVALILFLIVREILRLRRGPARIAPTVLGEEPAWRPDEAAARDLLAAADSLAAQGQYGEAAHLILLRSVEDLESRRPKTLRASLTTREIAALAALPAAARPAFKRIGDIVERSLFGGRAVGADDFAECRRAYEAFALPGGWTA